MLDNSTEVLLLVWLDFFNFKMLILIVESVVVVGRMMNDTNTIPIPRRITRFFVYAFCSFSQWPDFKGDSSFYL